MRRSFYWKTSSCSLSDDGGVEGGALMELLWVWSRDEEVMEVVCVLKEKEESQFSPSKEVNPAAWV